MPNADGRTICKELKKEASALSVPIILFSADEDLVSSFQDCQADAFIVKPFDIKDFIDKVKSIINTNREKIPIPEVGVNKS